MKHLFKLFLWGLLSLHLQYLLFFPLFYFLPLGGAWAGLSFLLALVIYGIYIALSYLSAVFVFFKNEEIFEKQILLLVLWAILSFANIKVADCLTTFLYYQNADIQQVKIKEESFQTGSFFQIEQAQFLPEYTYETLVAFSYSSKGQPTRYEKIPFKMTPIVSKNWQKEPIFLLAVYNQKEHETADWQLQKLWHKPLSSRYAEKYTDLVENFFQKYPLPHTPELVFLENINLEQKIQEEKQFLTWFYGILMGLWGLNILFLGIFRRKSF